MTRTHLSKQEFLANLHATQAYCERQLQADMVWSTALLRSLNPDFEEGKLFYYQENHFTTDTRRIPALVASWHPKADPYASDFLATVFEEQLAAKQKLVELKDQHSSGEVMVVEYDLNIADGASAVESEGFVDCLDFPPIDTWFYRVQKDDRNWVLFAWVPKQFMPLVQEAIDVHFLDIMHWFKDWKPVEYLRIFE